MKKLPGPYDNGPEYEGLISRFIKRFRAKRELNKRAIARRKEIETALRDCRLGLCTLNQARERCGLNLSFDTPMQMVIELVTDC